MNLLRSPNTTAYFYILESLLSILLSVHSKVPEHADDIANNIMKFLSASNPKTRKISIDIFYTVCAIDQQKRDFHQ